MRLSAAWSHFLRPFAWNHFWQDAKPSSGSTTTTLSPTSGAVTVAGNAPAIVLIIAAVVGTVTLAGNTPAVGKTLSPSTGAVTVAGSAPAVGKTLVPTTGALTFAGSAPSVSAALVINPSEGVLTLGGNAPALAVSLLPNEGSVEIDGYAPSISTVSGAIGFAQYAGGFFLESPPRKRLSDAERREKYGVFPKRVEAIIKKVAKRKIEEPDLNLDAALHRALDRERLAYRALYAEVLRLEVEQEKLEQEAQTREAWKQESLRKEQDDEDEVLLLL